MSGREPYRPNNPGYTPEHNELEKARKMADELKLLGHAHDDHHWAFLLAIRWLAAEVRVMRLERALER